LNVASLKNHVLWFCGGGGGESDMFIGNAIFSRN